MPAGVVHWDEIDAHRRAKGEMDAEWQWLGRAAGCVGVGLNRVRVAPGKLPTPPHSHGASEELYYVLSGSGLAWQDDVLHEVRPGDCVIHRADEHEHTFVGGPDGLEYLVFATNYPTELGWLPRSRAIRLGWPWVEGRTDDPWDVEATVPPLAVGDPAPRPDNIVNLDEVSATGERSVQAGLRWKQLERGTRAASPHCHSEEEEIFVILEGECTLELWPSPVLASRGVEYSEVALQQGHVVSRPPGTKLAHSFLAGGDGVTMLLYGTREPNDIVWYPRSNKIYWRGLGVVARVEALDLSDD